MRLILIRHGRPDENDHERPNDPPLNAEGWTQARAVARLLEAEGVTRIVASPLLRAQQTAAPLAETLAMPIETIEGWAEADRKAVRYRSTETLRAEGGAAWARFLEDPIGYLGGNPEEFRAGVLAALRATAANEARRARCRLHAWTSDQCRARLCARSRQRRAFPRGLWFGDAVALARGRGCRRFERQRDRAP